MTELLLGDLATILVSVGLLAVATYGLRLAGPLLRSRVELSAGLQRLVGLTVVAVFAALVTTTAVFEGQAFAGVARPVAVVVAAVLAWRRAPFPVVILVAAAVAALLRLAGVQ